MRGCQAIPSPMGWHSRCRCCDKNTSWQPSAGGSGTPSLVAVLGSARHGAEEDAEDPLGRSAAAGLAVHGCGALCALEGLRVPNLVFAGLKRSFAISDF